MPLEEEPPPPTQREIVAASVEPLLAWAMDSLPMPFKLKFRMHPTADCAIMYHLEHSGVRLNQEQHCDWPADIEVVEIHGKDRSYLLREVPSNLLMPMSADSPLVLWLVP